MFTLRGEFSTPALSRFLVLHLHSQYLTGDGQHNQIRNTAEDVRGQLRSNQERDLTHGNQTAILRQLQWDCLPFTLENQFSPSKPFRSKIVISTRVARSTDLRCLRHVQIVWEKSKIKTFKNTPDSGCLRMLFKIDWINMYTISGAEFAFRPSLISLALSALHH